MTVAFSYGGFALTEAANNVVVKRFDDVGRTEARDLKRLQGRGAPLGSQTIGGRKFRLAGDVVGSTQANHLANLSALEAAFSAQGLATFVVDDSREIQAYVSKAVSARAKDGLLQSTWQVELTAPEPVFLSTTGQASVESVTGGTTDFQSISNGGDAPANWRCEIVAGSDFDDGTIEIFNETTGRVLRLAGFGLTTSELLVVDTSLGRVAQESGAWPDSSFGIEVQDGEFWYLEPGTNRIRVVSDQSVTMHWIFRNAYWGPG